MEIEFVTGDLIQAAVEDRLPKPWIISHVVNNQGVWGAGFVVPLGKAFPQAKEEYLQANLCLGCNIQIPVQNNFIYNMCAQILGGKRPLDYGSLAVCMIGLADDICYQHRCKLLNHTICCPRFGAGLAGGKWEFIEELIYDCWIRMGIPVQVWTLPEEVNKYAAH